MAGKPGRSGRKKGIPNKVTAKAREVFAAALEANAPKLDGAISAMLDQEDPSRGVEALLRLSERFIPVLARTEITGKDDGPITVIVQTLGPKPDGA